MKKHMFSESLRCLLWLYLGTQICLAQTKMIPIGITRGLPSLEGKQFDVKPAYEGKQVRIQGVIHQRILWKGSQPGKPNHAFLIQNRPGESDQNPNTSDGLFVYTGKPTISGFGRRDGYEPAVGDLVQLQGVVGHRYGQTELTKVRLLTLLKRSMDVSTVLPQVKLDDKIRSEWNSTLKKLESLEGMRVQMNAGAVVQSGLQIVGQGQDALFWVLPSSHPVARRNDIFHNRTFRDAHPLDDLPLQLFDNNNGARILLGSLGIKGQTGYIDAALPVVRTGDTLTGNITGSIVYSYGKYKFMPTKVPGLKQGADPSKNRVPLSHSAANADRATFRVVTYNLENLYDYRDDPNDPCDSFQDKGSDNIQPPFNYLPSNESHYRNRLKAFAGQIIQDLNCPDLLLLQEIEDQDMLSFDERRTFKPAAGPDGAPDVLQELSLAIQEEGGPVYRGVLNRAGADERGISCAFFYRMDRIQLKALGDSKRWIKDLRKSFPSASAIGDTSQLVPIAIQADRMSSNLKADEIYPRPLQIARFSFVLPEGPAKRSLRELLVLNNHFSSRPQERVSLRRDQAKLAAAVANALKQTIPEASLIVAGDLNVYPRPDDPHPGRPSDQLSSLYETGMVSVYDRILKENPANAYSYVFEGQAQTLDHCFLSNSLQDRVIHAEFVHLNADWPAPFPSRRIPYPFRGISDHDPLVVTFRF